MRTHSSSSSSQGGEHGEIGRPIHSCVSPSSSARAEGRKFYSQKRGSQEGGPAPRRVSATAPPAALNEPRGEDIRGSGLTAAAGPSGILASGTAGRRTPPGGEGQGSRGGSGPGTGPTARDLGERGAARWQKGSG